MTNKDGYEFTQSTCNALTSFDQSLTNINPNIEQSRSKVYATIHHSPAKGKWSKIEKNFHLANRAAENKL